MLVQANDGKMLVNDGEMLVNDSEMFVNDGEMLVNDGEMSVYTHFTIINKHLPSLAWSKPSFAHLTIIEKPHRLDKGSTQKEWN